MGFQGSCSPASHFARKLGRRQTGVVLHKTKMNFQDLVFALSVGVAGVVVVVLALELS